MPRELGGCSAAGHSVPSRTCRASAFRFERVAAQPYLIGTADSAGELKGASAVRGYDGTDEMQLAEVSGECVRCCRPRRAAVDSGTILVDHAASGRDAAQPDPGVSQHDAPKVAAAETGDCRGPGRQLPCPRTVVTAATVLVYATICPARSWRAHPRFFSNRTRCARINVQVPATGTGKLLAANGLRPSARPLGRRRLRRVRARQQLTGPYAHRTGHSRCQRHRMTPICKRLGRLVGRNDKRVKRALSGLRAPVETAVAQLKTWRVVGGQAAAPPTDRYSPPRCRQRQPARLQDPMK